MEKEERRTEREKVEVEEEEDCLPTLAQWTWVLFVWRQRRLHGHDVHATKPPEEFGERYIYIYII